MTSQVCNNFSTAEALWYDAPGSAVLRQETLAVAETLHDSSKDASGALVRVRTLWSGISRGTERLVSSGRVPPEEYGRMRAPFQGGDFPFPVKYGYCAVGEAVSGPPEIVGKTVFALYPHQTCFDIPASSVAVVSPGIPPRRAALAANMETALNAVWDSGAGPGDRIVVIGAGIVGLLIAWLCAQLPGADVTAVDPQEARAEVAHSLGVGFALPGALEAHAGSGPAAGGADIVFHASAKAEGLASALSLAGFEGRIVEVSWYGNGETAIPLGGAFHSRRLQIVSSQVGSVSASRRARWTYGRRLAKALDLLGDDRLDALITDEFAFHDLPRVLPDYLAGPAAGLAAVVRYP
ncbi:MAG: zinc-binding alcohol dehydrogenase [Beijerinckiaceae bacterium]